MEQYNGDDIDPGLWFYVPMSRANVLGLVKAARAGLSSMDETYAGYALGAIGAMEDWLRDVSSQHLEAE